MILISQIKAIFLCFVYGLFFCFSFLLFKKSLLYNNVFIKLVLNLLFVLDHILLFFILLGLINNDILHIYYIFPFLLGILFYIGYFTDE